MDDTCRVPLAVTSVAEEEDLVEDVVVAVAAATAEVEAMEVAEADVVEEVGMTRATVVVEEGMEVVDHTVAAVVAEDVVVEDMATKLCLSPQSSAHLPMGCST